MSFSPFQGPAVFTRYKEGRIIATHKRDRETTYRAVVPYQSNLSTEDNHERAARACLDRCGFDVDLLLVARGHDQDGYAWVFAGSWQLPGEADRSALDAMANLLSGAAWDADVLSTVADLIRQTGRTVDDLA